MGTKMPTQDKPNIRAVAERAKVSPATVSLALRGSQNISAATRERVQAAAHALNYVPTSRNVRQQQVAGRDILFLTKNFAGQTAASNPFYGEILNSAEQECSQRGDRLMITVLSDLESTANEELPAIFSSYKPDGILLVGAYMPQIVAQVASLAAVPLVLVDNRVRGITCDSVMADDFMGAWQATRHLIELGHRRIAVIGGDMNVPSFAARYRGYAAACTEMELDAAPPREAVWQRASLRAVLEQILAEDLRPTAIFCMTDAFAVFTMELLRDFGLAAPQDISVVGFDNLPIARMAHPPLTTIHNHPEQLGRLAVQRLIERLDGDSTSPLNIAVATELIIRESTRKLAA